MDATLSWPMIAKGGFAVSERPVLVVLPKIADSNSRRYFMASRCANVTAVCETIGRLARRKRQLHLFE